jgi:integrative and conjugative element protein (TIGR02256 family)
MLHGQESGMTVWLTREVHDHMSGEAAAFAPLETGGVLVGWRNGSDWIATGLIGAGPKAMHGRYAFVPDHAWQVKQLAEAFAESGGDLDYLGDWHTHPTGPVQMSVADRRTLRRIARRTENPLMIIMDPSASGGDVGAWHCKRVGWLSSKIELVPIRQFEAKPSWPFWLGSSNGEV